MSSGDERISDEEGQLRDYEKTAGAPGVVVVPEDPAAPSKLVSSKRQRLSDIFTIVRLTPSRIWAADGLWELTRSS